MTLRERREALGLSQRKLASLVGVNVRIIGDHELSIASMHTGRIDAALRELERANTIQAVLEEPVQQNPPGDICQQCGAGLVIDIANFFTERRLICRACGAYAEEWR